MVEKKRKNNSKVILGIIILIVLGFFIYSYLTKGFFYSIVNLDQESLVNTLSSLGAFSFLAYIFLIVIGIIFAPIHPFIFYVTGGIVFGPYLSWGLTMVGVAIGSSIAFKLSQKYGREFVDKHVSKKHTEKFDKISEKYGSIAIFLLRLNPLTSSDVWSYIAGLTKIKFWRFLGYTLLGLAPAIFVQVYFGKEIGDNPVLFKIFVGIAILYLTVLILGLTYFYFIKRKDKLSKKKENKDNREIRKKKE
jgi:uncharacterized membrane protein YdjX (TVP38/TMEM64 family)